MRGGNVPALHTGIDTKPPLTAGSAELADSVSRRLRSTSERPRLIHRSGLPEAASGTVRGLAVASGGSVANRSSQHEPGAQDAAEQEPEPASGDSVDESSRQRVVARRRSSGLTTAIDVPRAATVQHTIEPDPPARDDDPEPGTDRDRVADAALAALQPGLQHTVIRRRPGSMAPRPIGLQAPLTSEDARQATMDAALAQPHESEMPAHETAARTVAATVGRLHRADVTDVRVRRDREADLLAASEHARAVTRGGEVFIPASEGRLNSGSGSGLLAHEFTHVIQQRRLGRSVPLEHSPGGRRLEADAAMTERHVRGDPGAPAPQPTAVEPPPPAVTASQQATDESDAAATARDIQEDLVASGRAFRMPDGSLVFPGWGRASARAAGSTGAERGCDPTSAGGALISEFARGRTICGTRCGPGCRLEPDERSRACAVVHTLRAVVHCAAAAHGRTAAARERCVVRSWSARLSDPDGRRGSSPSDGGGRAHRS